MLISTALNVQQIGGLCFDRAQHLSGAETSGLGFDRAQHLSGAETCGLSAAETQITVNLFLEIA